MEERHKGFESITFTKPNSHSKANSFAFTNPAFYSNKDTFCKATLRCSGKRQIWKISISVPKFGDAAKEYQWHLEKR
jgi:hypothetical protein